MLKLLFLLKSRISSPLVLTLALTLFCILFDITPISWKGLRSLSYLTFTLCALASDLFLHDEQTLRCTGQCLATGAKFLVHAPVPVDWISQMLRFRLSSRVGCYNKWLWFRSWVFNWIRVSSGSNSTENHGWYPVFKLVEQLLHVDGNPVL